MYTKKFGREADMRMIVRSDERNQENANCQLVARIERMHSEIATRPGRAP